MVLGGQDDDVFRDLCESANDLIHSVGGDGRFSYVNRAWRRTLGYGAEELAGLVVLDVVHAESRSLYREAMERALAGQEAIHVSAEFVRKDGGRVPVDGSVHARLQSGLPPTTHGIFRDVSLRKRAQEELDRLFELSSDLLCIAGMDGYFKRINPAFERILGYSREELLQHAFIEFVHPQDRASTLREVENLAQGRTVVDFQNRYRARDGTYRWLAWRSSPWPSEERIYAVARDITDHKRDQETLVRQARELARSNAELEQFAYVASHDLRSPLRAVAILTRWIEEGMPETLSPAVREHLKNLRDRVGRMERLTEDLLRYSRASRERVAAESIDTAVLIRDLAFLLAPPQGMTVTADPSLPRLRTERAPLEQVFRNLLENAIKHHDRPSGRVVVSARELREQVEFRVSDDGPGIPPELHERVFGMFQRLPSRAGESEGAGIGLALVRQIVERHGGRVWIESGEGRGATFAFTWPRRVPGAEAPERSPDR